VVLVLLSRFKHDVVQMTANFVDLMVIDRDTAAFLFTIFPNLRRSVIATALVIIPLMYVLWRLDPFRIRRLPALAATLSCLAALSAYALSFPDEQWRSYDDDEYLSKFARSGIIAVSDFVRYGFMESDAMAHERLKVPLIDSCHPAGRRPNIIMIHDESSFDIRQAPGIKVPPGYGSHCQVLRRQGACVPRRGQWRPELVHRIQRARRLVLTLIRPLFLFRHAHRRRPRRAWIAALAAPWRRSGRRSCGQRAERLRFAPVHDDRQPGARSFGPRLISTSSIIGTSGATG
jgi:hypothetical protein